MYLRVANRKRYQDKPPVPSSQFPINMASRLQFTFTEDFRSPVRVSEGALRCGTLH
ncbi:Protein of unknown function [Pyronema omphalodes CBS 100304]|uniref:Uncharacterized protein n=1 Tax=Pyronema omphalodes (strain CBS 100304) TaxID=1076935 RepID=U4LW38_PYROM|nr:Protein of unknown function [Pyronema omphalodes CBS 100304]